jgi:hypothetical protein
VTITAAELGLATLEQPTTDTAPYDEYWTETFLPAWHEVAMVTGADKARAEQLGELVMGVACTTLATGEIDDYTKLAGYSPKDEPSYTSIISLWDSALGSYNSLQDAQPMLLNAAWLNAHSMAQSTNRQAGLLTSYTGSLTAVKDAYQALEVDPRDPGSLKQAILAAELVHKAAWVDPIKERQINLFDTALGMYDRIIARTGDRHVPQRWRAIGGAADIKFHRASDKLRGASLAQDEKSFEKAKAELRDLTKEGPRHIKALYAQYNSNRNKGAQGELKGLMFEFFVAMTLRDQVLDNVSFGNGIPGEFEVRSSFIHEAEAPAGIKPKPSFDLVVRQHDKTGQVVATRSAELKIGRAKNIDYDVESRSYFGATVIRALDFEPHQMADAAAVLASKYGEHNKKSVRGAGPAFHQLRSNLTGELLKT